MINIYIYIYIPYIDSPKVGYIIIRGANETRQLASYSDSTRSKLDSSKLDLSSSSTRNVNELSRARLE